MLYPTEPRGLRATKRDCPAVLPPRPLDRCVWLYPLGCRLQRRRVWQRSRDCTGYHHQQGPGRAGFAGSGLQSPARRTLPHVLPDPARAAPPGHEHRGLVVCVWDLGRPRTLPPPVPTPERRASPGADAPDRGNVADWGRFSSKRCRRSIRTRTDAPSCGQHIMKRDRTI